MYYPHYKNGLRYKFTLQCPNLDNQLTLSLLHDATVTGDLHYYDVCKVADSVNIAYNERPVMFEVEKDDETMTMVETPAVMPVEGWYSFIPYDWEIIKAFLDQHNLTPIWIDCEQDWGVLDEETGTWTGAVGMVIICSLFYCFIENNVVSKIFI